MKNEVLLFNTNIVERENLDYNELITRFLRYIDVSKGTSDVYERSLRQFYYYLNEKGITTPTRDDVLDFKEYLKENKKPNTTNLYLVSIKSFYKWLEYEGITKDITKNIKSLKIEKKHLKRSLTKEEMQNVINVCSNLREETLIKLMATCGLREHEVVNIRLRDFYLDNNTIMLKVLGKGRIDKVEVVKIDNRVFELIKKYCEEYEIVDYLFVSTSKYNTGNKVTTESIRQCIKKLFKKANIDDEMVSPHSIRHFSATQCIKAGMSIVEVSEMMRHSSIATTQIYIDEINKSESKFANILSDIVFD